VAVRSTRLSNRLSNPFDNRLYRVNGVLQFLKTGALFSVQFIVAKLAAAWMPANSDMTAADLYECGR